MKKRQLWIAAAGMFLVVFLMFANMASAAENSWMDGVPGQGVGSVVTGNEPIITVTGTVNKIGKMYKMADSLQMNLTADKGGNWIVYMGPKWFVENQMLKFAVGDKVEVRGKKLSEGMAIIASEISKKNITLKFRDEENGRPTWLCCFPAHHE